MHGREQQEEGESLRSKTRRRLRWSNVQHMRSVPVSVRTTTTTTVSLGDSALVYISSDSFRKDGRTISVGDCALFEPSQDSPPFIGIIRRLSYSKESTLQLHVNWLYRPAELKLDKSILQDVAPNEIFYSFHEDAIPAAALLHPCRVAFLPKGVELPSGISAFVCRRVYDIKKERLWWLTDQDYIDERQEEVNKLLHKTRIEMHATVQPGGRSPKPANGPSNTSQLRPASDNVQNVTTFPTQVKGKKRERMDQGTDPVKRERSMKTDDGDAVQSRIEYNLKSEIAKITEEGGLVDSEAVEKLVHLMQPDRAKKKMDLLSRSILAAVIAATDKFDCLNRFVELRGLPVLDEWLQDIHKGKIGDGNSSKDGGDNKPVEEFLLVLLHALDKLPVNLHALQMCNIGRSVNHLRSHKNSEIQKKARSLVDTWKKRVEAEMNVIDAKSGSNQTVSWPSKSRLPEAQAHIGNRNSVGSGDIAGRSSVTQLSISKTSSNKPSPGETTKSACSSPGPGKSASSPASVKESHQRATVVTSDAPITSREDKSSSSSQSHNCSQSLSSKEDAKSSTAGSMSVSKVSTSGSRHRKSNGFPVVSVSAGQKETGSSRTLPQRGTASEKLSLPGLSGEKSPDAAVVEGSNHKLIVKIPNKGRVPAQTASGGSFEDPSIMSSRASSPVLSDKHGQFDRNMKDKSDAYRPSVVSDVNAESWQSNDVKDVLTGSNDGDGSPAGPPDEERIRTAEDTRKAAEVSKAASSSSGNGVKSSKLHDASFSSMNALIESCVKYSEVNPSMSIEDDVGMNLLASVAAGEISKSDVVSPIESPQCIPLAEGSCKVDNAKSNPSSGNNLVPDGFHPKDESVGADKKHIISSSISCTKDESHQVMHASPVLLRDRNAGSSSPKAKLAGESQLSNREFQTNPDRNLEGDEKLDSIKGSPARMRDKTKDDEQNGPLHGQKSDSSNVVIDRVSGAKLAGNGSSVGEVKVLMDVDAMKLKVEKSNSNVIKGLNPCDHATSKPASKVTEGPVSGKDLASDNACELKFGGSDGTGSIRPVGESERQLIEKETSYVPVVEDHALITVESVVADQKNGSPKPCEKKENLEDHACIPPQKEIPEYPVENVEKHNQVGVSKLSGMEGDSVECSSSVAEASSSSIAGATDSDSKVKFDLNEGFVSDDGKCGDPVDTTVSSRPSSFQVVSPFPFSTTSVSSSLPASVTVAAAAKGPFVPPEDLLRSKGELGWKGSAATSAFRPAEPRKVLQTQSGAISISSPDASTSKPGRAPLDIDLNVPDERVMEDFGSQDSASHMVSSSDLRNNGDNFQNELAGAAPVRTSGGLDLDLNRSDEPSDMGQYPVTGIHRTEPSVLPLKPLSAVGLTTSEVRRDFDLNNGPSVEDASAEPSSFYQHTRGNIHTQPSIAGLRISNTDLGNLSSWFPPGNTYSTVTVPSMLPERGQQPYPMIPPGAPQRILGPAGNTQFASDVYRGSVLSTSPAAAFPSSPFQYPVYPFGTTFPLPSASFSIGATSYIDSSAGGRLFTPPMNSQFLGPIDAVSSHYTRPYVVTLPESSSVSSSENNRKWSRQSLDLNAGPGAPDVEAREEALPLAPKQPSLATSQPLAQEQARMYPMGGGFSKRKEPDGGWENDGFRYKQSSWQ